MLIRPGRITKLFAACLFCALVCTLGLAQGFVEDFEKAEMALRFQKWQSAIKFLTKVIQENPKFFVAYHKRAFAYSKTGQYDKCLADLKKATELKPDYPEAYALMGLVYEIQKSYPAALKAYKEALKREKRSDARKVPPEVRQGRTGKPEEEIGSPLLGFVLPVAAEGPPSDVTDAGVRNLTNARPRPQIGEPGALRMKRPGFAKRSVA